MASRRITSTTSAQPMWTSGGYVYSPSSAIKPVQPTAVAGPVSLGAAFKPKRAGKNPKLSHIIFVLDDSGSMQSCRQQTIDGFNEYLKAQQADSVATGIETLVSLYKFDGWNVNRVVTRKPVAEVEPLTMDTYNPQGGTNLNDAIGGVMIQINNDLAEKKKEDRESVIITILTDGEENQSKTFTNADVKAMVEKADGKNWGFMFLGANINAFHAGASYGFTAQNTLQYDTANAEQTIMAASAMTSRMRSAYSAGFDNRSVYAASAFTAAERASAVGKDDE